VLIALVLVVSSIGTNQAAVIFACAVEAD